MSNMRSKLMAGLKKRESSMLADPHLNRIGEAVRKSKTPLSKDKIYEVAIEQIADNPFQYRSEESLNHSDLKSLASSIAEHGLRTPLQLRRVDGGYQLVAGWRRLTAIRKYLRSMTTVKATIDETMTDKTHRLLTILENEQREDFTVFEKAKAYSDMITLDEFTLGDVAEFVGSSKSRVSRILKLNKITTEFESMLRKGLSEGLSNGHLDEIVIGYQKREEAGFKDKDILDWAQTIIDSVLSGERTIADIRAENKKPAKKPLKKKENFTISGGEWKKFIVTPQKRVTLEFQLPEGIEEGNPDAVISYIKETLLQN